MSFEQPKMVFEQLKSIKFAIIQTGFYPTFAGVKNYTELFSVDEKENLKQLRIETPFDTWRFDWDFTVEFTYFI